MSFVFLSSGFGEFETEIFTPALEYNEQLVSWGEMLGDHLEIVQSGRREWFQIILK